MVRGYRLPLRFGRNISIVRVASSGSSQWKVANWHAGPQQIAFAVLPTGGSSWAISVTYEDPRRLPVSEVIIAIRL
jgi:hypothetical protein